MGLEGTTAAGKPGFVYIVDDDAELCTSLEWLVGSVGLEARSFHSAVDFLEVFDPSEIACLVVDVRMPEVSGFRLQEILRERGAAIPTVFVSAHGDIKMSVRALQQGAMTFLEKPYEPQHLLDVVQEALSQARTLHDAEASRQRIISRLETLTHREHEVLVLVLEGAQSKIIASTLGISTRTVDVHRTRIREKSGAESIAILVRDILQSGVDVSALAPTGR